MTTLLAVTRFVHLLAAVSLFGGFAFAIAIAAPANRVDMHGNALEWSRLWRRLRRTARWSLSIGIVSAAAWFALQAMLVSGLPMIEAMTGDVLGRVATETAFGRAWLWRFVVALALAAILFYEARTASSPRGWMPALAMALAGLYLATLAFAGHAAASQGFDRYVRIGTDGAHLIAAGAWIGALPGLVMLLAGARRVAALASIDVAAHALRRFSWLGIVSVGALVASGFVNSWYLVNDVPHLLGTSYGQLLMLKLLLFFVMFTLAAVNRIRFTPRIAGRDFAALRALARNAAEEAIIGVAVLAIVAVLGITVPAAHQEPVWPLAFTVRVESVDTAAAAGWIVAMIVTVLCAAGALMLAGQRRGRVNAVPIAIAGVVALAAATMTCPYLSIAPAYPTTYAVSPVRYSTSAIAQGAALFADNCVQCHGVHGRGDGPMAVSLTNKPVDLVEHAMHHSAGDMFWWISHGIPGTAMPPFGTRIPDSSIWSLIEFLRAQSDSANAELLTSNVEPWRPIVAPDFTFELASRRQESLKDQRGHLAVLLVLYTWPQSRDRLHALADGEIRFSTSGLRVIAVPLNGMANAKIARESFAGLQSIAALVDADVGTTYAMFGATEDNAGQQLAPSHIEFLIDRQGYLRARWLSVPADGVKQTKAILDQLSVLNEEPPRGPAPEAHMH